MIEGAIDLRLGPPCDPPPDLVIDAMASAADSLGPYGKSVGSPVFRQAAADWMRRRLDVEIDPESVAACVGTKEFVAGLALLLGAGCGRGRDTVLIPAVAYPTYAVGAELAGCRVVRVPMGLRGSGLPAGRDTGAAPAVPAARAVTPGPEA